MIYYTWYKHINYSIHVQIPIVMVDRDRFSQPNQPSPV